jgi:hypothetical protein
MDTDGSCTLPAPYRQGRRLEQEALEERRVLHRLRQDPRVMGTECTNRCGGYFTIWPLSWKLLDLHRKFRRPFD